MVSMRACARWTIILVGLLGGCALAQSTDEVPRAALASAPFREPPAGKRLLVFVSDFHMGVGKKAGGSWDPTEDFRWHGALGGFLDEVTRRGADKVDLVIVGDFLELWQPPAAIPCRGPTSAPGSTDPDLGCSVTEAAQLATHVASQHATALASLREFSNRGENRVRIIPGNHDAALLLAPVWKALDGALGTSSGRVELVTSGLWSSRDGRVVAEHGHQIGADVNRFDEWPSITRVRDGAEYLIRPWGERFVQEIFNAEEAQYPIIDNLSPEAAGARYRMQDRGAWRSMADMARFIRFNLFETSLAQKASVLGPPAPGAERPKWDVKVGRAMGYRLFADALDPGDPFRKTLLEDHPDSRALREQLDSVARDSNAVPDGEVRQLCDQIAIRTGRDGPRCQPAQLGMLAEKLLASREWVMREHLEKRLRERPNMRYFIYGHTHHIEAPWKVLAPGVATVPVMVANSGAFQRLVDEPGFMRRTKAMGLTAGEGLARLVPEDLAPCYGVVLVSYDKELPSMATKFWWMEEGGKGAFVEVGDARCQ